MSVGNNYRPLRLEAAGESLTHTLDAAFGSALALARFRDGVMLAPYTAWSLVGAVLTVTGLAAGDIVLVMRATPGGQVYDLTEAVKLDPEALQAALDSLAKQVQDSVPDYDGGAVTVLARENGAARAVVIMDAEAVAGAVADEVTAREGAVSAEALARAQGDAAVLAACEPRGAAGANIAAHDESGAAHGGIGGKLSQEILDRQNADTAEATARANADNAEATARVNADNAEALARAGAVAAEALLRIAGDNETREACESVGVAAGLVAIHNADAQAHGGLVAQVPVLSGALALEEQERLAAEALISAALAAHEANAAMHLTTGGQADGAVTSVVTFVLPSDTDNNPLWPEVTLSAAGDFSSPILYDGRTTGNGVAALKIFDGSVWVAYPSTGAGVGYYGKRVAFTVPNFAPIGGQVYFIRVRVWDGTAWGDYAGQTAVFSSGKVAGGGEVTLAQMNAAIAVAKAQATADAVAVATAGAEVAAAAQVAAANALNVADAAETKADAAVVTANAAANVANGLAGDVADAVAAANAVAGSAANAVSAAAAATLAAETAQAAAEMAGQNLAQHAAGTLHPHEQYLTLSAYNAATKTVTVNGFSGAVVLNAANVGAEPDLGNPAAGLVLISGANKARAWGTMPTMTGASAGAASVPGAVPVAAAGMQGAVLHGDGVWRKKRHYFTTRLLSQTEVITNDEKVGFRIPLAGKLVGFGLFVDRTSASDWFFYAQLLKNGVASLASPLLLGREEGSYVAAPELNLSVMGPADLWKVLAPAAGTNNLRMAYTYGLSVWFVVEEL
jgi:hypothetical protein